MRYALGKPFTLTTPPQVPDVPAPVVKVDVEETIIGVEAGVLKLTLPPVDLTTTNKLLELRAYLVVHGHPVPADADAFVASGLSYTAVDVSDPEWVSGGAVDITLPTVDDLTLYAGQLVHGYQD